MVGKSKAESERLAAKAEKQEQEVKNIRLPLNSLKFNVDNLKKLRLKIQNQLSDVYDDLKTLDLGIGKIFDPFILYCVIFSLKVNHSIIELFFLLNIFVRVIGSD